MPTRVRHFRIHNLPKRSLHQVPRRIRPILNSEVPDPGLFPIAGELEGALADWLGEGLVRGDGGEPFALRLVLVSQPVDQTQRLTLRSQPLLWPVTQAVDVVLAQFLRRE